MTSSLFSPPPAPAAQTMAQAPSKLVPAHASKFPSTCPGCSTQVPRGAPYWYAPQGERGRRAWCVPCGTRLTGHPHSGAGAYPGAAQATAQPHDDGDPWDASTEDAAHAQPAQAHAPKAPAITAQASPADPLAAAIAAAVAPLLAQAQASALDVDAARAVARDELARSLRRLRRAGAQDSTPEPVTWIPEREPDYDPDTTTGRALRACVASASHSWTSGPSGSGKTFPLLQECAALGRPVVYVSCTDGMDRTSLLGSWILWEGRGKSGAPSMAWMHGPLPRAMHSGAVLALDEADKLAPALSAILFGVCEPGKPRSLVIPECGQEIRPAPGFTVACTGNTLRDTSGLYSGQRPDAALVSRLLHVAADYLPVQTEARILGRYHAQEGKRIAQALVNLRAVHAKGQADTPPSLRVGITVARLLSGIMPSGASLPAPFDWRDAWGLAYLGSLSDDQAKAARTAIGGF